MKTLYISEKDCTREQLIGKDGEKVIANLLKFAQISDNTRGQDLKKGNSVIEVKTCVGKSANTGFNLTDEQYKNRGSLLEAIKEYCSHFTRLALVKKYHQAVAYHLDNDYIATVNIMTRAEAIRYISARAYIDKGYEYRVRIATKPITDKRKAQLAELGWTL